MSRLSSIDICSLSSFIIMQIIIMSSYCNWSMNERETYVKNIPFFGLFFYSQQPPHLPNNKYDLPNYEIMDASTTTALRGSLTYSHHWLDLTTSSLGGLGFCTCIISSKLIIYPAIQPASQPASQSATHTECWTGLIDYFYDSVLITCLKQTVTLILS